MTAIPWRKVVKTEWRTGASAHYQTLECGHIFILPATRYGNLHPGHTRLKARCSRCFREANPCPKS